MFDSDVEFIIGLNRRSQEFELDDPLQIIGEIFLW
jgi:hypothetical protein